MSIEKIVVRNVLREAREGTLHDGALDCPWCGGVSRGSSCENPACEAEPCQTRETVLARRERQAELEREREDRERRSAAAAATSARWRAQQQAELDEIREQGYCPICWRRRRGKVRHRRPDFHDR